jgi:hypothetical protein
MSAQIETVTAAGTATLNVAPVLSGTQTVARTSVNACTALAVIPAVVAMNLIMVAVVILAVWLVEIAVVDVIVIPIVWPVVQPNGTDVIAVSETVARPVLLDASALLSRKRKKMLRKTRRLFTLAAKKERLKRRSKWRWAFRTVMQVISALYE